MREEFKKIAPAQGLLEWRLMELAFGITATVFPLVLCSELLHFETGYLGLTPGQQISGVAAVALFALFIWTGRLSYKILPVVTSRRVRGVITACCVVPLMLWWIAFFYLIAPHQDFTMSQFTVAFLWAFATPAGVMMGLLWGIEAAARKRTVAAS